MPKYLVSYLKDFAGVTPRFGSRVLYFRQDLVTAYDVMVMTTGIRLEEDIDSVVVLNWDMLLENAQTASLEKRFLYYLSCSYTRGTIQGFAAITTTFPSPICDESDVRKVEALICKRKDYSSATLLSCKSIQD